jgi:hypothetical protein
MLLVIELGNKYNMVVETQMFTHTILRVYLCTYPLENFAICIILSLFSPFMFQSYLGSSRPPLNDI